MPAAVAKIGPVSVDVAFVVVAVLAMAVAMAGRDCGHGSSRYRGFASVRDETNGVTVAIVDAAAMSVSVIMAVDMTAVVSVALALAVAATFAVVVLLAVASAASPSAGLAVPTALVVPLLL